MNYPTGATFVGYLSSRIGRRARLVLAIVLLGIVIYVGTRFFVDR